MAAEFITPAKPGINNKIMKKIAIYKTENAARSAAKADYAEILGCKPSSLRLYVYGGHYRPTSCRCVCGETACIELVPRMTSRQDVKMQEYKQEKGMNRNFWYGVCSSCGIN